eukprot:TRINITY_DN42136_c0_g1_i1.p1 TRINITY_DN42136_c0_g1~~TRINITY_DN42136_c0_g1_i1.p1  ORF type:complete len:720 (+),score=135.81 TRINITY_DN42136_c0_g1_i1:35-2161(+)
MSIPGDPPADYLTAHAVPRHLDAATATLLLHRPPNIRTFLSAYFETLASGSTPATPPCPTPPTETNEQYINRIGLRGVIDRCIKSLLTAQPADPLRHLADHFSQDYWALKGGKVPECMVVVSRRVKDAEGWVDTTFDAAKCDRYADDDVIIEVVAREDVPVVTGPEGVTVEWVSKMLLQAGVRKSEITEVKVVDEQEFGSPLRASAAVAFEGYPVGVAGFRRASSFSPAKRSGSLLPSSPLKMDIDVFAIDDQGAQSTVYTIAAHTTRPHVPQKLILKLCKRSDWCDDAAVAAREMWFYKEISPFLKNRIKVPRMYWGGCCNGVGNVILEDITASHDVRSTEISDWEMVYRTLADLHKIFFNMPAAVMPMWWPNYPLDPDILTENGLPHAVWIFGPFAGSPYWKGPITYSVVDRLRTGVERLARYGVLGEEYVSGYDELFANLPGYVEKLSGVRTVCRGDCHLWNSFVREGEVVFYDFAEWSVGHPAGEIAYAWYSSWLKDQAPIDYMEILEVYYERVEGEAPFSFDQLVYDFRVAAVFVIILHLRYVFDQWEGLWEIVNPVSFAREIGAETDSYSALPNHHDTLTLTPTTPTPPPISYILDATNTPCTHTPGTIHTAAHPVRIFTPITWSPTPTASQYEQLITSQWHYRPTPGHTSHPTSINTAHKRWMDTKGGPEDADLWDSPLQFYKDLYDMGCWLKEGVVGLEN